MNPYDWIKIHTFLRKRKEVEKYKHYLQHVGLMIRCYISEIAKDDFELRKMFNCTVSDTNDTA